MCEVLLEAPANGFTEAEVTGGKDVPGEVRRLVDEEVSPQSVATEDPEQLVRQLERNVDTADLLEAGAGDQILYAYGYRCSPDRLQVGRGECAS